MSGKQTEQKALNIPIFVDLPNPESFDKTVGVLIRDDGSLAVFISGQSGPGYGTMGIPSMHRYIKTHVESHACALMRRESLSSAFLYLNRIPCSDPSPNHPGCQEALPNMLPERATLRVIVAGEFDSVYRGLPDPPRAKINLWYKAGVAV